MLATLERPLPRTISPVFSEPVAGKFRVEQLSVSYGERQVLNNISVDVEQGTVRAIIGPSGCGKSTLLKCLNRTLELTGSASIQGRVLLEGNNIYEPGTDLVDLRRRVGMVFQRPNPFPKTIFDNVAYGPRMAGVRNKAQLQEIVEVSLTEAALFKEVKDRLKDHAFLLSGGQQQRLCIARALAMRPQVLLMDEPCSALDPSSTAHIEETIGQLKGRYTIVIVTHNMHQAARVSSKTLFLLNGVVEADAPTEELFHNPANKVTEDYIRGRFG